MHDARQEQEKDKTKRSLPKFARWNAIERTRMPATLTTPGRIIVLNGAPRSGKSSIVAALQERTDAVWMNLGVDVFVRHVMPPHVRPGIGLRPGEQGHGIEPLLPNMFAALYESIAAHSRLGFDVAADVGHHADHPAGILPGCAIRLGGLPALLCGVRCPIDAIMARRNAGQRGRENAYVVGSPDDPVPAPVRLWQEKVHDPGIYDVEVDTSRMSPGECAQAILRRFDDPRPLDAFRRLASMPSR
jgi:chloramphenicol 3-O phosphotransferase